MALFVVLDALDLGEVGNEVFVGHGGVVLALGNQTVQPPLAQQAIEQRQDDGHRLPGLHFIPSVRLTEHPPFRMVLILSVLLQGFINAILLKGPTCSQNY